MLGPHLGIRRRISYCMFISFLFTRYIFVSVIQKLKWLPPNDKKILFILEASKLYRDDDGSGRYPFLILNGFSRGGYNVYLYRKMNFKKYMNLRKYGRYIYSIKNLKFINKLPSDRFAYILAFDQEKLDRDIFKSNWRKIVYVNAFKPASWKIGGDLLWIPYFFHMYMYKHGQDKMLAMYRTKNKKIRVFFGGNTDKDYYNSPNLKTFYGQLTRIEGLGTLLDMPEVTENITNAEKFYRHLSNKGAYLKRCVLFQTNRFTIHPKNWFGILSRMDFFLCLSGTTLPMCHHTIESMALGVIPILSYPSWFFPPLEHRKNAILYSNKEDLKQRIKDVLAMDSQEVAEMKSNVIRYYENHLSNAGFIRRFEANRDKVMTLMLHPLYVCDERDKEENAQAKFDRLSDLIGDSRQTISP